jgi:hypothetical protein
VRLRDDFVGAQTRAVVENLTCDDYLVRAGLRDEGLAQALRVTGEVEAVAQRLRRIATFDDRRQIKD